MSTPCTKKFSLLLNYQNVEALMEKKKFKKVLEKQIEGFIKENQLNQYDM